MNAPILEFSGESPREWGREHGETLRDRISELYQIRLNLTLQKSDFGDEATTLQIASMHIPILTSFDEDLCSEMCGIAEGSGLSLEKIILVNHYTDLRDLSKGIVDDGLDPGGCSALFTQGKRGPILAQTWDMHGSATDHVCFLKIPECEANPSGPTWMFSISGCVGMTGLNRHGLGMTINNLISTDAQLGIVWPVLVRRALKESNAKSARDLIMHAPIGSGHHYIVADENEVYGVETSGLKRKVIQQGTQEIHLHTNHALSRDIKDVSRVSTTSTTHSRYATLCALRDREALGESPRAVYDNFAEVSMVRPEDNADAVATCGAWVMDLKKKRVLACKGLPAEEDPLVFECR